MGDYTLTVAIDDAVERADALGLLIPAPIDTPHQSALGVETPADWAVERLAEAASPQTALLARRPADEKSAGAPTVVYRFSDTPGCDDGPFLVPFDSPWSRPSSDLAEEIRALAGGLARDAAVRAIIDHTAERFTYGHVDDPFHAGADAVPALSCGLAKGSCIDINTYVLGAMAAIGVPAQYFAGYFFPAERGGVTNDMHCWVATWADGERAEWDIAHHKKMGHDTVVPGYNPKPGKRFALSWGRGLTFAVDGRRHTLSHFSEPLWLFADGPPVKARISARLDPFD